MQPRRIVRARTLYAPCVYARRVRPRDRGSNNKCAHSGLFPDGAELRKRGSDFLAGATVPECATSLSDVQWPARRNVTSNWANDRENPLRETPTEYTLLNPISVAERNFYSAFIHLFLRFTFQKAYEMKHDSNEMKIVINEEKYCAATRSLFVQSETLYTVNSP